MEALTQIKYKEGMTLEEVVKEVNKRIEVMRKRSLRFEERFNAIDKKLDGVDQRFNVIDKKMDDVNNRLNRIETTLSNDLNAIKQTMETNQQRFDILFKHLGIEDEIKDSSNTTNN